LYTRIKGLDTILNNVAEPHPFFAAPAPGKNFDAAPAAPAPANELKFKYMLKLMYLVYMILYDLQYIAENMN
jgi:hypothetical protein